MAKRFGRNQERAMREAVAAAERRADHWYDKAQDVMRSNAELSRRLHSWATEVVHLMGEDSAFNERVKRFSSDFDGDIMRIAPHSRMQPVSMRPGTIPTTSVYTVLEALIWRLNVSRDEFSGRVRMVLENRHGEPVGYVLPRDHRWSDRDAEQIARLIVAEMRRSA